MAQLSEREQGLWRGFLTWSESVRSKVAADLAQATDLSVGDFEILVRLKESGGTVDQRELGADMSWSASRLSHQLSRMEARGLLQRSSVGVGRLMKVDLTPAGDDVLSAALDVHATAVREHFLSPMTSEDAEALIRLIDDARI